MKRLLLCLLFSIYVFSPNALAETPIHIDSYAAPDAMQCVAFGPYVGNLNPVFDLHPTKELIDTLLDKLIRDTPFRCIMTYGVTDGLDHIFAAAKLRNLKVIAIIWLDSDIAMNTASIASGIEVAKAYPDTIIRLSCGSEVRTRHGNAYDEEIVRCIDSLHQAGVTQPITTIDTWWEWCDRDVACEQSFFADQVDWIGVNIFPWWENKFSSVYSCTPAEAAADFHIARLEDLHRTYSDKEIIVTEFGWPNGPDGGTEYNQNTEEHCGIASQSNQQWVVKSTFQKLAARHWSGVVFEAFDENWKPNSEGNFGSFWGICQGTPPYTCGLQ